MYPGNALSVHIHFVFINRIFSLSVTALVSLFFDLATLYKMMSLGTLMAYSSVSLCVILVRYRVKNICLPLDEDLDPNADDVEEDEEKAYLSEDPVEDNYSSSKGSPEKESYRLKAYKKPTDKETNSEVEENCEKEPIVCEDSNDNNASEENNELKVPKYGSKNGDRNKDNNHNKESSDNDDCLPVGDRRKFTIGQSSGKTLAEFMFGFNFRQPNKASDLPSEVHASRKASARGLVTGEDSLSSDESTSAGYMDDCYIYIFVRIESLVAWTVLWVFKRICMGS